jgi:hypothetical protein
VAGESERAAKPSEKRVEAFKVQNSNKVWQLADVLLE